MSTIGCLLIFLGSVVALQAFDLETIYYKQFCKQNLITGPLKTRFCEYFKNFQNFKAKPFPAFQECSTCNAFIELLIWNNHTETALSNLLKYTQENYCNYVKFSKKQKCKIMINSKRNQILTFLRKIMTKELFCKIFLNCTKSYDQSLGNRFNDFLSHSKDVYPTEFFEFFHQKDNFPGTFTKFSMFNGLSSGRKQSSYIFDFFQGFLKNHKPNRNNSLISYWDYKSFFRKSKNMNEIYSWAFFEYFLISHGKDEGFNFYYFFNNYLKNRFGKLSCQLCEIISPPILNNWFNKLTNSQQEIIVNSHLCKEFRSTEECYKTIDIIIHYWKTSMESDSMNIDFTCRTLLKCEKSKENIFLSPVNNKMKTETIQCTVCKKFSDIISETSREANFIKDASDSFRLIFCPSVFKTKKECSDFLSKDFNNLLLTSGSRIQQYYLCRITCPSGMTSINYNTSLQTQSDSQCPLVSLLLMETVLSAKYKMGIKAKLEKAVCNDILINKTECDFFMRTDFNTILITMIHLLNDQVLCPNGVKTTELKPLGKCNLCMKILHEFHFNLFSTNIYKNIIREIIKNICILLDPLQRSRCNDLNTNSQLKIIYLLNRYDVRKYICASINQCLVSSTSRFFSPNYSFFMSV